MEFPEFQNAPKEPSKRARKAARSIRASRVLGATFFSAEFGCQLTGSESSEIHAALDRLWSQIGAALIEDVVYKGRIGIQNHTSAKNRYASGGILFHDLCHALVAAESAQDSDRFPRPAFLRNNVPFTEAMLREELHVQLINCSPVILQQSETFDLFFTRFQKEMFEYFYSHGGSIVHDLQNLGFSEVDINGKVYQYYSELMERIIRTPDPLFEARARRVFERRSEHRVLLDEFLHLSERFNSEQRARDAASSGSDL